MLNFLVPVWWSLHLFVSTGERRLWGIYIYDASSLHPDSVSLVLPCLFYSLIPWCNEHMQSKSEWT